MCQIFQMSNLTSVFHGQNLSMEGPGRNKKRPKDIRDNILRVCLTKEEKEVIDRKAHDLGLDCSSYGRMVLLQNAREIKS